MTTFIKLLAKLKKIDMTDVLNQMSLDEIINLLKELV